MAGRELAFSFLDEEETSRKGRRLLKKRSRPPIIAAVLFLPPRVASSSALPPPFLSTARKNAFARFSPNIAFIYIYIYIRAGKKVADNRIDRRPIRTTTAISK